VLAGAPVCCRKLLAILWFERLLGSRRRRVFTVRWLSTARSLRWLLRHSERLLRGHWDEGMLAVPRGVPQLVHGPGLCDVALHYVKVKVKRAAALQTLYKHYNNLETMETTPRIIEILVWFWRFVGNLMTSLQLANCFMFVPRWRETLGCRQWTVA